MSDPSFNREEPLDPKSIEKPSPKPEEAQPDSPSKSETTGSVDDDQNTMTVPIQALDQETDSDNENTLPSTPTDDLDDEETLPPLPSPFRPTPPPTETDPGATIVNPSLAFPWKADSKADSNVPNPKSSKPTPLPDEDTADIHRSADEIRAARRQQRKQALNQPPSQRTRQAPKRQPTKPAVSEPTQRTITREDFDPAQPSLDVIPAKAGIPPQTKEYAAPIVEKKQTRGCLPRAILTILILGILAATLGLVTFVFGYIAVADGLPDTAKLAASDFETGQIYDRDGNLLYQLTPGQTNNEGNRTYVELSDISPYLITATIATEDSRFYENPGFDPISIARASFSAVRGGDLYAGGGASTITQQVVRALLLEEDERNSRTVRRKLREIILAAELGRTREKDEILELYLNEIYYGNRAYGIEAASQTYFKKSAKDLTLAEASLLAGLPQAPALWDPVTAPEFAEGRQSEVLTNMVNNSGKITRDEAIAAIGERLAYTVEQPQTNIQYPHFTVAVLQELEATYGPEIYRGGFRITTTIDPDVQRLAEEAIHNNAETLDQYSTTNAALVAIDPRNGEILALVGSRDYNDEAISGNVNMALTPRQTGSAIKPLVFLSAIEKGWTPSTLLWDVPSAFPDGPNPAYVPKNYDDSFHGGILLRQALGNSYNIPAVKALEFVGICPFMERAQSLGVSLSDEGCEEVGSPRNIGLSLALGGVEVSPLEMATAFATMANNGRQHPAHFINRIEAKDGTAEFQYQPPETIPQPIQPQHAYLMNSILSDDFARRAEFEPNGLLTVPNRTVAAKTGTSGTNALDVKDGWTVGYTPEIVTAVWVGNTDNRSMGDGASGYRVASPIWNSFMSSYLGNRQDVRFEQPSEIINLEICASSGVAASEKCAQTRQEIFFENQPPQPASQHFFREQSIDLWTLRLANEYCNDEAMYSANSFELLVNASPEVSKRYEKEVDTWLRSEGQWWAGQYNFQYPPPPNQQILLDQACDPGQQRPRAIINEPAPSETRRGVIKIGGEATAPDFSGYQLEYGIGENPQSWTPIGPFKSSPQPGGELGELNLNTIGQSGPVTIRLVIFGADNPYTQENDRVRKEQRVTINVDAPTLTPTSTAQPTATNTPIPTRTPVPIPTDTPEPTATATQAPVESATATPIPPPTDAPTEAPTAVPPTIEPTEEATSVPLPPTNTPIPFPTDTPVPAPTDAPTEEATAYP